MTDTRSPFIVMDFRGPGTVTATKATLDSIDVLSELARRNLNSFSLDSTKLGLGAHTLSVHAENEFGNEFADVYRFEVAVNPRVLGEIALSPGGNLIALPRWPRDNELGVVFSGSSADRVVTARWQGEPPDAPVTIPPTIPSTVASVCVPPKDVTKEVDDETCVQAVRGAGDSWSGTLTHIGADKAYWVHSTGFAPARVELAPDIAVSTTPGTQVNNGLAKGENLVGIMPSGFGDDLSAIIGFPLDADIAFGDLVWLVAYTFDTNHGAWLKLLPGTTDRVFVGEGYYLILYP